MSLTIELSPEAEARLRVEAAQRNQTAEAYAKTMIEQQLPLDEPLPFWATATKEEWIKAFREWTESHRDINAPPIPDEALRRENLYEDRGL